MNAVDGLERPFKTIRTCTLMVQKDFPTPYSKNFSMVADGLKKPL